MILSFTFCFWVNPASCAIDMKWTSIEHLRKASTHLQRKCENIIENIPSLWKYSRQIRTTRIYLLGILFYSLRRKAWNKGPNYPSYTFVNEMYLHVLLVLEAAHYWLVSENKSKWHKLKGNTIWPTIFVLVRMQTTFSHIFCLFFLHSHLCLTSDTKVASWVISI